MFVQKLLTKCLLVFGLRRQQKTWIRLSSFINHKSTSDQVRVRFKSCRKHPPPAHTMLAALGLKKGLKCKLNLYPRQKAKEKLSDLFAVVQTVPKPPEILKYKIKKINIGLDNWINLLTHSNLCKRNVTQTSAAECQVCEESFKTASSPKPWRR